MQNQFQQLKSGFKRTINWNKCQSNSKTYAQNRYLNHLFDPSFQRVNRIFVLSLENEDGRIWHLEYYLHKVEIKDYNITFDGNDFFDQPTNDDFKTYIKILEKLQLVEEMFTQLLVCQIFLISKIL